jgi:acetoacetate decarboxylase
VSGYPPAPWRLAGELTLIPACVRLAAARRFAIPPGARLLGAGGRTLGGAMLADYRSGTLVYRELIVFSALAALRGRPGFVVSHVYVDSEASMRGGRALWGLPKELADFTVSRHVFEVRQGGALLLRARLRRRPGRLPLWLPAPTLGAVDGTAVHPVGVARVRAAPALVRLEVPAASAFAPLGLAGTHPALAGDDLRLTMHAP